MCHLGVGVKGDLDVDLMWLRRVKTRVYGLHCISIDQAPSIRQTPEMKEIACIEGKEKRFDDAGSQRLD